MGDALRAILGRAAAHRAMPDLTSLISQWGYAAIFLIVVLGNAGLPVPEETVLTVAGYLVWQGRLAAIPALAVAIVSAVIGDNAAYWLGRRYGQELLGRFVQLRPERVAQMQRFVERYGALAVFVARFVAGLRFMAGPLAGSTGLAPIRFFVANFLGAAVYVPIIMSAGYAVGYGFGESIERLRRAAGGAEKIVLAALVVVAVAWLALALRGRRRS